MYHKETIDIMRSPPILSVKFGKILIGGDNPFNTAVNLLVIAIFDIYFCGAGLIKIDVIVYFVGVLQVLILI